MNEQPFVLLLPDLLSTEDPDLPLLPDELLLDDDHSPVECSSFDEVSHTALHRFILVQRYDDIRS